MLEHVAGTMAILLGAGTSRAEEAAYITLNRLGNALYYLFYAIRADLLRRLGRDAEAASAYEAALARTENAAERAFLRRRLLSLNQG